MNTEIYIYPLLLNTPANVDKYTITFQDLKEQLKKDYLQAHNSYVTKHFTTNEIRKKNHIYPLCENTSANVDKLKKMKSDLKAHVTQEE